MEPEPSTSSNPPQSTYFRAPFLQDAQGSTSDIQFPPRQERTRLSGTTDLLGKYDLLPLYDEYVRPYIRPPRPPGKDPKGKGKAVELGNEVKGEAAPAAEEKHRKIDRSYAHLIGDLPGNYSSVKDEYMQSLLQHPDYQHVEIYPFDEQTLRDSFTLQPGIIDNWEEIVAGPQEVKPKKKRKKRRHNESVDLKASTNGAPPDTANPAQPADNERDKKKRKKQ